MLIVLLIVFILLGVLGLYLCNETNIDESIGVFIGTIRNYWAYCNRDNVVSNVNRFSI